MKISLLCPTRKRAHFMKDMWKSALETCSNSNNIEVVFAIDQDDSESIEAYFGMSSDNTKAVLSPSSAAICLTSGFEIVPRGNSIYSNFSLVNI